MNQIKQLLTRLQQRVSGLLRKEQTVENNTTPTHIYTEEQLMARLKFFIGICLSLTLFGIVFVVLYSLIFVTQPLNAISPIDQKFFELIIPIATFLTGTLSGIMLAGGDKDLRAKALDAANKAPAVSPSSTTPPASGFSASASFGGANMSFNKPLGGNTMSMAPSTGQSFAPAQSWGTTPVATSAPMMSSTGKPMPVQPDEPEL
jgi:hypothetical protein